MSSLPFESHLTVTGSVLHAQITQGSRCLKHIALFHIYESERNLNAGRFHNYKTKFDNPQSERNVTNVRLMSIVNWLAENAIWWNLTVSLEDFDPISQYGTVVITLYCDYESSILLNLAR